MNGKTPLEAFRNGLIKDQDETKGGRNSRLIEPRPSRADYHLRDKTKGVASCPFPYRLNSNRLD